MLSPCFLDVICSNDSPYVYSSSGTPKKFQWSGLSRAEDSI